MLSLCEVKAAAPCFAVIKRSIMCRGGFLCNFFFSLYKLLQHINTHVSSSVQCGAQKHFLSLWFHPFSRMNGQTISDRPGLLRSSIRLDVCVCASALVCMWCMFLCVCWARLSLIMGRSSCTKEHGHTGASSISRAAAVFSGCSTCWLLTVGVDEGKCFLRIQLKLMFNGLFEFSLKKHVEWNVSQLSTARVNVKLTRHHISVNYLTFRITLHRQEVSQ